MRRRVGCDEHLFADDDRKTLAITLYHSVLVVVATPTIAYYICDVANVTRNRSFLPLMQSLMRHTYDRT